MAFSLYHAYHTPQLEIAEISVNDLDEGLQEITAVIVNTRMIPTHSGVNMKFKIDRPNYITLEGANVLAGMIVKNRDLNVVEEQKINPAEIEVENILGMGTDTVRWIVDGGSNLSVIVDSAKGGIVRKEL